MDPEDDAERLTEDPDLKVDKMAQSSTSGREGRIAPLLHLASLIVTAIFIAVVVAVRATSYTSALTDRPGTAAIVAGILAVAALNSVGLGYALPRLVIKGHQGRAVSPRSLQSAYVMRIVFYQAVALSGLVLGVLGAHWYLVVPYFVVVVGLTVQSFVTSGQVATRAYTDTGPSSTEAP